MPSPLPYFPFWPSDFFEDERVQLMSPYGWGCYLKLLAHQWREGSVPSDQETCRRLCLGIGRSSDDDRAFIEQWPMIAECFLRDGPRMVNLRLDKERVKALGKCDKARKAVQEREKRRSAARPLAPSNDDRPMDRQIIERSSMQSQSQSQRETHPSTLSPTPTPSSLSLPVKASSRPARPKPSPEPAFAFEPWIRASRPDLDTPRFREAWLAFEAQRAKGPVRTRLTAKARELALNKLKALTPDQAAEAVERSVIGGWQGIFPERLNGQHGASKAQVVKW